MNRELIYTGQLLPVTSLLRMSRDPMIGFAKLAAGVLGTATKINGFACAPTGPASMQVQIGAGEIYSLTAIDSTAFGDLGTDARQVLKQGLLLDPVLLAFTAPVTAGQSINYLVQVSLQEQDVEAGVLPYYNLGNTSAPYLGPNNTGASQATRRNCAAVVSIKAGSAAATGTQTTPAPDAGNVGAWVVTVANGQTTITGPNITAFAGAPFIGGGLDAMLRLAGGQSMTGLFSLFGDAASALQPTTLQQLNSAIASAVAGLSLIGVGQTWQILTGFRSLGTTYYNTTGKPITVCVSGAMATIAQSAYFYVAGSAVMAFGGGTPASAQQSVTFIVPPGLSYSIQHTGFSLQTWAELR